MANISKLTNKKKTSKIKKKAFVGKKTKSKSPIKISKNYVPKDTEKYMCDKHQSYFKTHLLEWKKEIVKANLFFIEFIR